ncbi:uncharacterized protein IL334_000328 [Kwoniella shivajii]|uniref:F-box domain-containing protein n=1 Tax=Kwoniella shivajii TaxID=564305 RepID=A0ABZ1CP05_9TREE|nr:hypothetical protein IL334_000328 [Kwoniella shivajii]
MKMKPFLHEPSSDPVIPDGSPLKTIAERSTPTKHSVNNPKPTSEPSDHLWDSDLTDLSDESDEEEDPHRSQVSNPSPPHFAKDNSSKRKQPIIQSSDSEEASDYDHKPFKKKKKKSSSKKDSGTKSTDGKGNTKKSKKKNVLTKSEDGNAGAPKRKVLLAKQARWKDLPNWGSRTDCPLLELPREILDECFGSTSGLQIRDYVALAGVSKFFRHAFTADVFHEICYHHKASLTTDWRVESPLLVYVTSVPSHYVPDGPREEWTEAQYIVYKEEQIKWKTSRKEAHLRAEEAASKNAKEQASQRGRTVYMNRKHRRVLAKIDGRIDGEPAIEKDHHGIPIKTKQDEDEGKSMLQLAQTSDMSKQRVHKKGKQRLHRGIWVTPDSDREEEEGLKIVLWDPTTGEKKIHDHWPNKWRQHAVDWMSRQRINKTKAKRSFRVTDAELLCLRNVLVPNPMSSKQPQQTFMQVAVEALSLRSHGGPKGHETHLEMLQKTYNERSRKREAKNDEAKEDGTYVYKHKKRYVAPYEWRYRDEILYWDGECRSDCEACSHGHALG